MLPQALPKEALVTAIGLAVFFAAGPISRGLRRRFPEHPFGAQVIVGGSIAVAAYCLAKALTKPDSKVPNAMLSRSWGVFGGAYQAMKNASENFDSY